MTRKYKEPLNTLLVVIMTKLLGNFAAAFNVLVFTRGKANTTNLKYQLKGEKVTSVGACLDCKTVRIFAYSSKREQSNERSGTRLNTESETGERRACEARALRACKTLIPRFTDFLTDFEKKTDCFAV